MMNTLSVFCAAAIMVGINGGYLGDVQQGVKTIFETVDLNSNNNCEWEKSTPMIDHNVFPFGMYTAVDTELFDDGISCGECYELKCIEELDTWGGCTCKPNSAVTVMVVDFGHDHWEYNQVFDSDPYVAHEILEGQCDNDGSKYEISYQQVCCNHLGNIKINNYGGINQFWLSFVISEVRGYGSITNFYMRESGRTNWYECERDTNSINANWVCDPWDKIREQYKQEGLDDGLEMGEGEEPYQLPIDIKITDSSGATLESLGLITNFLHENKFDFGSNFESEECPRTTTAPVTTKVITTTAPQTTTTTTTTTAEPETTTTTTTTAEPETTTTTTTTAEPEPETTTTTTTTAEPTIAYDDEPETTTTTTTTAEPTKEPTIAYDDEPETTTTTTTTAEPETTTTTTTTAEPVEECPEDRLGDECSDDSECPSCMKCCPVLQVCEMLDAKPRAQAIAMMNDMSGINDKPIVNKPKATNDPNMFGYILLVGLIAFILINNLFIGCWCLYKKNGNKNEPQYEAYEKCDIVAINGSDAE